MLNCKKHHKATRKKSSLPLCCQRASGRCEEVGGGGRNTFPSDPVKKRDLFLKKIRNKFRNQRDTGEPVTAQKPVFITRISDATIAIIAVIMITRFVKAAFCRKLRWYRD